MKIQPHGKLTLDACTDTDFCGLFKVEPTSDPKSSKSGSSFVITLGSVPVVWSSKLQTEMALLTG